MLDFLSSEDVQLNILLCILVLAILWLQWSNTRDRLNKDIALWCDAVQMCFLKNDFSCIPKGVPEFGIYKRIKALEKVGIDADLHYDKETLYVSKHKGASWQFEVY